MKKIVIILAVLALTATGLSQQGGLRIQTRPALPSRDLLERLSMKMQWSNKVPVDGTRDGFFSLQLFPGKSFTLLVAQTYKGSVIALNADTGDILWRTAAGLPYRSMMPVGANEQVVFAVRGDTLFSLDRETGKQLVYKVDPASDVTDYGQKLEAPPTAGVAADNTYLFACMDGRLVRYVVPNFRALAKAKAHAPDSGTPQLIRTWDFSTGGNVSQAPTLTKEMAVFVTDDGTVAFINKSNLGDDDIAIERGQFQTGGFVSAKVGSHNSMIYVPCQDLTLYALNASSGRLSWRFFGQAPIVDGPKATDADVFVVVGKTGLHRLERVSGNPKWSARDAVKFLATNQRFVYALDRLGKMLVIDYDRGKVLSDWDVRDWVLPIPNDLTDRVYLASNDGQIICLRHRDLVEPLKVKTFESILPKAKESKKKEVDKTPPGDDKLPKDKDDKDKVIPGGPGMSGVRRPTSEVATKDLRLWTPDIGNWKPEGHLDRCY